MALSSNQDLVVRAWHGEMAIIGLLRKHGRKPMEFQGNSRKPVDLTTEKQWKTMKNHGFDHSTGVSNVVFWDLPSVGAKNLIEPKAHWNRKDFSFPDPSCGGATSMWPKLMTDWPKGLDFSISILFAWLKRKKYKVPRFFDCKVGIRRWVARFDPAYGNHWKPVAVAM